ncbi:MAG: LysM peptidoglycan-binding domain-containing protein [Clostridia bacterium]|nr:LysM peptidoglycan-binding domain-containing protein [Clostridia bacterium]
MVRMKIYVVHPGDSLYAVSRRFGVSVDTLIYYNQIANPARLVVGQTLVIPDGASGGTLGEMEVNAYAYPGIKDAVLTEYLPYLTYLTPFTWMADAEGGLTSPGDASLITAAYRNNVAPMMSVANLNPEGGFGSDIAHALLTDQAAQDILVENIVAAVRKYDYYGVIADFEYIYGFDRASYNQFIKRLADVLHPLGCLLGVALAPKISASQQGLLYTAHDYAAQGATADFVVIMTYEWGYLYGAPQAVSPVNKVRKVLEYAVEEMPPGKILMGFSNYGYDWTLPWRQGTAARVVANANAVTLAVTENTAIMFDETAQAPYFNYSDAEGRRHVVWFEDARSAKARLALVAEFGLRGISWWTINDLFRQGLFTQESMYETSKVF